MQEELILGWRDRTRQLWPFAVVVAITFGLSALPPHAAHGGELLLAAGVCFGAVGVLTVMVPWQRIPLGSALIVVVFFCIGVGLMRASGGGLNGGYTPLLLLPIIWQALYGRPFELAATVVAVAATLVVPIVVIGGPQYPVGQWRMAVLMTLVGTALGVIVQRLMFANADMTVKLETLANCDQLTGLPNRRAWDNALAELLSEHEVGEVATLALIDLDHFKAFNDTHGHIEADAVLVQLARMWSEHLGSSDLLARWGGEEFAIVFGNAGLARASAVIRELAATTPESLTFSVGLLRVTEPVTLDAAMTATDRLLYKAKESGRSCLASATTLPAAGVAGVSSPMLEALFADRQAAEDELSALEVAAGEDAVEAVLDAVR